MRKRVIAKGNIHVSDAYRVLVTDTLPGDIPIIISNDGFYLNMRRRAASTGNPHHQEFVSKLLDPTKPYTIPYRYNIMRPSGSPRKLSLIHPSGQLSIAEFYRQYGDLICYYCRKSPSSIRSPVRTGTLFFVRGSLSERNRIKGAGIDTVDIEAAVSNPASYFSYSGYNRAYEFFNSSDYLRLEKRYSVMHFADIGKCFSSIYTHTLYWATADVQTAKDNTSSGGFSNTFDKIMQSINYNETNGICVGAEVSRVFAEIILSEIDRRIVEGLRFAGLQHRVHYEFRRYVDDYYIFSQNDDVAKRVFAAVHLGLAAFNLHLNEEKTRRIPRPFITLKSRMIRDANVIINDFSSKFIDAAKNDGQLYSYPKRVWRSQALLRSLLDSVKASCYDQSAGYTETSNYIISALAVRVSNLIAGYDSAIGRDDVEHDYYVDALVLLLEAIYFFYNVTPTVPSSLKVGQAAIRAFEFVKQRMPDRAPFVAEQIVRWTFQFIRGIEGAAGHRDSDCVPLEAINLLLVLGEVGRSEAIAQNAIHEFCGDVGPMMYFEIVSYLFSMKDEPAFSLLRLALYERAKVLIRGKNTLRTHAHAAHLALDVLSCPYFDIDERGKLFNELRTNMDLPPVTTAEANAAVTEFEEHPWFVNWRDPNLLRMIRKKELSAVY